MKFVRTAVVLAAAGLVLAPAAAQANTYNHADAASDVVSFTGGSTTATPQPDRSNGDVVASTVKHNRTAVVARMTYRDLANVDGFNGHLFAFKTSKMRREVTVVSAAGVPSQVVMTKPNGKKVSCRVKRSLDYTAHTVTVRVPRSCLGHPRWVKVGMASLFMTGLKATDTQYADDALFGGGVHANSLTYSPRVFR